MELHSMISVVISSPGLFPDTSDREFIAFPIKKNSDPPSPIIYAPGINTCMKQKL